MNTFTRRSSLLPALCISFVLVATGLSARAVAQNDENLYARALAASMEKIIKDWSDFDVSDDTRVRTDWKNIIVQSFPEITVSMPNRVGETRVEYLDEEGLIDRFKRAKKAFQIFQVHPMVVEGTRLKVWFSLVWFRYEQRVIPFVYSRRHFFFSVSEWSIVYFRFDPETRRYVVDEVKLGGI